MPNLIRVCQVGDIPDGSAAVVAVNGKEIAVFNDGGTHFAIDDMCPHAGASLSGGNVEGGCVTCPWHGWRFRLSDGAWADSPKVKSTTYPVHIVGDTVHVEVPDAAKP